MVEPFALVTAASLVDPSAEHFDSLAYGPDLTAEDVDHIEQVCVAGVVDAAVVCERHRLTGHGQFLYRLENSCPDIGHTVAGRATHMEMVGLLRQFAEDFGTWRAS